MITIGPVTSTIDPSGGATISPAAMVTAAEAEAIVATLDQVLCLMGYIGLTAVVGVLLLAVVGSAFFAVWLACRKGCDIVHTRADEHNLTLWRRREVRGSDASTLCESTRGSTMA